MPIERIYDVQETSNTSSERFMLVLSTSYVQGVNVEIAPIFLT